MSFQGPPKMPPLDLSGRAASFNRHIHDFGSYLNFSVP